MSDFSIPLTVVPHFSKRFLGVALLLHSGTGFLLIPLTFPSVIHGLTLKISIALFIITSLIHTLHYHILLRGHPLRHFRLYQNKIFRADMDMEAQVLSDSYVHPQLVILRVRLATQEICSLIIFPDTLDTATFRRLRVHIKYPESSRTDR